MNDEIVFLVGSLIRPMNGRFRSIYDTHIPHRSYQSPGERGHHTIFGLNSIFCKYPNAKVFLIEGSLDLTDDEIDQYCQPGGQYNYFSNKNIEIVKISDIDREACKIINTHENKSFCEALLFDTFLNNYKENLSKYDYVVKMSGRYSLTPNCNLDVLSGKDKIYFKEKAFWNHLDKNKVWTPKEIRLPNQEPWEMHWTPCFLFAFGKERIEELQEFFKFIMNVTDKTNISTEDAIYYWTQHNNINNVEELKWAALAYTGTDGTLWNY
jgi:hypothetical protein